MTQTSALSAPTELISIPQWVCYAYPEKAPINPHTGGYAQTNKPSTWGTYTQAQKRLAESPGKLHGIGIVFTKENGLTGIDFDDCIAADGTIDSDVLAWVKRFSSYTYITPSGRGLRIIVHGSIKKAITAEKFADHIEAYDHGRYFTITENHLAETPHMIESRQTELDEFCNAVAIDRKGKSRGCRELEKKIKELESILEPGRNTELSKVAFRAGVLITQCGLLQERVKSALWKACEKNGLVEEEYNQTERTLNSQIQAGIARGKQEPASLIHYRPEPESGNGNGANGHKAHLPDVILGGQLRDTTYYALKAMAEAEQGKPAIFVQTGRYTLVRVCKDKKNRPVLTPMAVPEIKHAMTQSANYGTIRENKKTGETEFVNMSPPKEVAEQILSLPPADWPFPVLDAIVEIPQMRPDGSILDTPGYDKITQLYYMPHQDLDIPAIPSTPTKNDIDQAVRFVTGFLGDFPWVSPADHANALGLWLTTVLRQRVRHVPIALISANTQGAGKGLLTDATALLATGQTASSLSQVNSDEEWDKRITALLMAGATFVSIDNVEGMLRSPILSKALTADSHSGRVLGISKIVSVPQRAIWVANGNNIQLGGDMPRRCYPINMIVQVSDPWTREDFKYPYLIKALTENRGKIIAALLTMARGWIVAGQPDPETKLRKLATFSEWVDLVGGILAYAGINGFLENLTEMHQKADIEGKAWTIFLEMWLTKLGDKEYYTAKELIEHWKADSDLQDTLPDPIATWFQDEAKTIKNKVGKLLAKKEGRPYGPDNLRIVKGDDTHGNISNFKVARYARYARYNSSLRSDENLSDSLPDNGMNIQGGNDAKDTSQISHTSHISQRDPTLCHMDGCTNLWDTEYAGKWLCSKHWIEART